MRIFKEGSTIAVSLFLLGSIEVLLKILYSQDFATGLGFVLYDPGKTLFHIVLLPLAAMILTSRIPYSLIEYVLRRNRRFPVFLLGLLVLVGGYHCFWESFQIFSRAQLMPYEIRGASAATAAFRYQLGKEVTSYYQQVPDENYWQALQGKKETYYQEVKNLTQSHNYWTGTTLYVKYATFLSFVGISYVVFLFVLTFSIIAGKIELEDRVLDAFILNILILSPWLVLRTYSEWYFSLGDYHIQNDSKLVVLLCLSILLVMHVAFLRKSRGFIRTFTIGLVLLIGTGLLNLLLNPGWIPELISLFVNLSPYHIFFLTILVMASGISVTWNRIKTFAYLHYITLASPLPKLPEPEPDDQPEPEEEKPVKPLFMVLPENLSREYAMRLENYFRQEKPYLDPELTIKKVSENLNMPLHQLSFVVNEWLGHSFPDYVNLFRIEEAKHKLCNQQYRHLKIENVGYECGFNSKATFNRVFKKYCQVSPSQFQKQNAGKSPLILPGEPNDKVSVE